MSNRQALEEPEEQVDLEGDDDDAGYGRRRGSRDDSEEPEEDDNDGRRDDYTGMEPEPAGGGKGGGDEEAGKGPDAANAGSEDERAKWDELLALPPHGSQVFIGGLPRDITEDDLRELCEPLGEIYARGTGASDACRKNRRYDVWCRRKSKPSQPIGTG